LKTSESPSPDKNEPDDDDKLPDNVPEDTEDSEDVPDVLSEDACDERPVVPESTAAR
nr:hypothetical protein [Escherichia coli]